MNVLMLITFSCAVSVCWCEITPTENYEHNTVLDTLGKFKVYWKFNLTDITFEIHGNTVGWIGIGLSPNGGMAGSDIYAGWVDNGNAYITDRYGTANTFPPKDPEQNVELLDGTECDGWTMLKFRRQVPACEANDRAVTADTIRLIYAYGLADPVGDDITPAEYHLTNRGTKSILLLEASGAVQSPTGETHSSFDLLNNDTAVPAAETYYSCKLFKLPEFPSKQHLVEIAPIVQAGHEQNVHHILLYQCIGQIENLGNVGLSGECYTANMPPDFNKCQSVIHAWAIGGGTFYYPQHVGFPLGEADSPKFVVMETHYDNPTRSAGIVDSSGLRIIYTPQIRQFDAGVVDVGHFISPVTQLIPPNADSYLQHGECTSDCLTAVMNKESLTQVNVFAVTLHTHLLGRKIELKHVRNGVELPYLAKENNYDFNYQEVRHLSSEVAVKPEDTLQLVCDYKSSGVRSNFTYGGLGTSEEMCVAFVNYYPKMQFSSCLSGPNFADLSNYFGVTQTTGIDFSITGSLDNVIITSPPELNGVSFLSHINGMSWDQSRAVNMSETFRTINRNQICIINGSFSTTVPFFAPALNISQVYVEPVQACIEPSTGMPTSYPASTCATAAPPSATTAGAVHVTFHVALIITTLITSLMMKLF